MLFALPLAPEDQEPLGGPKGRNKQNSMSTKLLQHLILKLSDKHTFGPGSPLLPCQPGIPGGP